MKDTTVTPFPVRQQPPPDPSVQEWTWMETIAGLETLVRQYGVTRVIQYLEHDAADHEANDILQRFGRDRVLRMVRNLAEFNGQAV